MSYIRVKKEDVLKAYNTLGTEKENVGYSSRLKQAIRLMFPEAFEEEKKEQESELDLKTLIYQFRCWIRVLDSGKEYSGVADIDVADKVHEAEDDLVKQVRDLAKKKVDEALKELLSKYQLYVNDEIIKQKLEEM